MNLEQNHSYPCCVCHSKPSEYALETTGVCGSCIDEQVDKPGRYQGFNSDRSSVAIALILESWDAEEEMYQEGWGWIAKHGQFHLQVDDRGFVEFTDHGSEEKSQKEWDILYADGWGSEEDDIYVETGWNIEIWQNHKKISYWPRKDGSNPDRRIDAAIYIWMKEEGYFPNVWDIQQYGVRLRKMHSIPLILQ